MDATESHEEFSPKYPHVSVNITYLNRNALNLINATMNAMNAQGVPCQAIEAFATEAMSGNFHHVLQTMSEWVDVQVDPCYEYEGERL